MNITRRDVLKYCLIMTAGAGLLPSCMQNKKQEAIALKNLAVSGTDMELLTAVCETIIPATDTPGAKDTASHLFVLQMLDDMYSGDEQKQFIKGMKEFEELAQKKVNKPFADATAQQREDLISGMISDPAGVSGNIAMFLKTAKKLTVQSYTTSKYYLTKVRLYELVPGRFHGCFPVSA